MAPKKNVFDISWFFSTDSSVLIFFAGSFPWHRIPKISWGLTTSWDVRKMATSKNGKGQFLKDEAVDSVDVICHISKYLDVQVIFIWTIPQQSAWILPAVTCTKAP